MNNKQIHDLTLRLSQALDQNYDVVSLESVLSVITALEGATITKEQLEATRLAKYINQLRRRTKSDNLARRAKSLLKKWREMVGIQQVNDSTAVGATGSAASNSMFSPSAPSITPDTQNTVNTSQLTSQQMQNQRPHSENTNQQHHSQPTSPLSYVERTYTNELINSTMSNPALVSFLSQSGNLTHRNKKRLEKKSDQQAPQQPTSFANLITGLDSSNSLALRKSRDKCSLSSSTKPTETFIIDHSSNSNSDKNCMPSNAISTCTSSINVPPIVIDLQDSNSGTNSFISKDFTKASLPFSSSKPSMKKSKKEKKRKGRDILNQSLHDCDDNTTTTNPSHQRPPDMFTVEEKSHYACATISNISEILSLSNSSMSSEFPFTDTISKNIYDSCHNELASSYKMSQSDLTFAGKFKQSTSSTSTICEVLNYKSDNVMDYSCSSPNKNKFTPFAGIGVGTNSTDSTSNSHILQCSDTDDAVKQNANNSKQNVDELRIKHESNDKSISNSPNKGNSTADNVFNVAPPDIILQQQYKSIDLTTINLSSETTIKQPKKRGRKKGSKGVDSVIAKETSLSSHMLISSLSAGVKKVKTTKELYAEMQSRKLHNAKMAGSGEDTKGSPVTNLHLQQQQKSLISSRGSSCSDIAESDSCTMTSEPSCDSANPSKIRKIEKILDSNSNYSQFDLERKENDMGLERKTLTALLAATQTTATIQDRMLKMLKQLPPPTSIKDIEQECLTNVMPCTCTILEIFPKTENDVDTFNEVDIKDFLLCARNKNDTKVDEMTPIENENPNASIVTCNIQMDNLQQPPTKLKKSIFDLDFEDEEDPLNSIIADIIGKTNKSNDFEKSASTPVDDGITSVKLKIGEETLYGDQILVQSAVVVSIPPLNHIIFPTYEVKLDPDCLAKTRFDIQTQKITKFHIDSLHNCLIPNVNGNWSNADVVTSDINTTRNNDADLDISQITDGYRVVPCYGSEINEHIVKDLSHVKFTKKFKHNKSFTNNKILNNIPFMGVARIKEDSMKSQKREKHRKQRDMLMREEKFFIQSKTQSPSDFCSTPVKSHKNNCSILDRIAIDIKSVKQELESTSLRNDNLTTLLFNAIDVNCTNSETSEANNVETVKDDDVSHIFESSNEMGNENADTTDINNLNSRRSSSSMNSFNQYQHSLNVKLKHQRREEKILLALENSKITRSDLKRRAFKDKNFHIIQRLKIAINANKGAQSQISGNSCDNTTDENTFSEEDFYSVENLSEPELDHRGSHPLYEIIEDKERYDQYNEEVDDYDSDYHHEVVTRDINPTSSGEKHIVLTIKKTHLKSNSAVNFVSAVSTGLKRSGNVNSLENNVEQMNIKLIEGNQKEHFKQAENQYQQVQKKKDEEKISSYNKVFCKKRIEMPRLKCLKKRLKRKKVSFLSYSSRSKTKLHKLLFFSDEICHFIQQGTQRGKEYIFNISSCSSSCTDEDDKETVHGEKELKISEQNYCIELNKNSSIVRSPSVSSLSSQCSESSVFKLHPACKVNYEMTTTNAIENVTSLDNDDTDNDDDLPLENNRMLLTFNDLCCNTTMGEKKIKNKHGHEYQLRDEKKYHKNILKQPLQNCDDNLYNSNFSIIKYIGNNYSFVNNNINSSSNKDFGQVYNSSSNRDNCNIFNTRENINENVNHNDIQISTYKEYNTIKRGVDEDVNAYDNSYVRLQQFKEWHEVLQLRSYNDELLTVLPYVVLE